MDQQLCYYAALGVAKEASPEEIKAAYYKAVLRSHPDKEGACVQPETAATASFHQIQEAWEVGAGAIICLACSVAVRLVKDCCNTRTVQLAYPLIKQTDVYACSCACKQVLRDRGRRRTYDDACKLAELKEAARHCWEELQLSDMEQAQDEQGVGLQ